MILIMVSCVAMILVLPLGIFALVSAYMVSMRYVNYVLYSILIVCACDNYCTYPMITVNTNTFNGAMITMIENTKFNPFFFRVGVEFHKAGRKNIAKCK